MVIVRAHLIRGRSPRQKQAFVAEVTGAVCRVLTVPPEQVRVTLIEIDPDAWGIAGQTADALRVQSDAVPPGEGTANARSREGTP